MALATIQDILSGFPGWATLDLSYGDEISRQGSGATRVKSLRPPLWTLEATTRSLSATELLKWRARLAALENGKQLFTGYDMSNYYPIAYPNGTWPTGGSFDGVSAAINAINANNKALKIDGLPAGYKVSTGDFVSFVYGVNDDVALHQAMEDATADGTGLTGYFEVRPHIKTGAAADDVVSVKAPSCQMMLLPGSISPNVDPATGRGTLSFKAIQWVPNA